MVPNLCAPAQPAATALAAARTRPMDRFCYARRP
jgi:hypothetical protein